MDAETIRIGAARVTLLNCGAIEEDLAEWLPTAGPALRAAYGPDFAGPLAIPIFCALIQLPGRVLLVDACHPEILPLAFTTPQHYTPPPGLLTQLAAQGVAPEDVGDVVLTHLHSDHFNGLTRIDIDSDAPTFPRARHHLGLADWDAAQPALENPASPESRTLGAVHAAGLLELVAGPKDLGDGLWILPAPGETPGHQIVRLKSQGRLCFCLGDLFHHLLELEHPEHVVHWAEAGPTSRSRAALMPTLAKTGATLCASHIAGFGRLSLAPGGALSWERVLQ